MASVEKEVQVFVGEYVCEVSSLGLDALTCSLPTELVNDESAIEHGLNVTVGIVLNGINANIRHFPKPYFFIFLYFIYLFDLDLSLYYCLNQPRSKLWHVLYYYLKSIINQMKFHLKV